MIQRKKTLSKPKKAGIILVSALFLPVGLLLFLLYGPFEEPRSLWITTAMATSNCRFLATSFFPQEKIEQVLADNKVLVPQNSDRDSIPYSTSDEVLFAKVNGDLYTGYLVKIMNPQKVYLATALSQEGSLLEEIAQANHASGGINASGYTGDSTRGETWGYAIADSTLISECKDNNRHSICGMNQKQKLIVGTFTKEEILQKEFRWAVEFGPILLLDGAKSELTSFSGGLAPRTAIGQTADGAILLLVIDGRQPSSLGATYQDLQTILEANAAVNAFVLDGGSSSSLYKDKAILNHPSDGNAQRKLPNALLY